MQTFLPYPDFALSAEALDRQRLGKQRVENLQIVKTICVGGGWSNHPAVRMWRGHIFSLVAYQDAVCKEWVGRGYRDTCRDKTYALIDEHVDGTFTPVPPWLGRDDLHLSHRSNLLRKDPAHYGLLFKGDPDDLEYVWPV